MGKDESAWQEPPRPVPDHREISRGGSDAERPRGGCWSSAWPSSRPARTGEEDLRAALRRRSAAEAAGPAAGQEARRRRRGDPACRWTWSASCGRPVHGSSRPNRPRPRTASEPVPSQVQALDRKLGQIENLLVKLSEELDALKARPEPAAVDPEASPRTIPPEAKSPGPTREAPQKTDPASKKPDSPAKPPATNLLPADVYNTAQADYAKGNYDLAIDGFAMYPRDLPGQPASRTTPCT